jgi:hypothetical protein
MDQTPVYPQGTGPLHEWAKRVTDAIWGRGKLNDSPDILIRHGSRGTSLELKTKLQNMLAAISGMNYRSDYDAGKSYAKGDVVRVRSGAYQGVYVCVVAATAGTSPIFPEPADATPGATTYWEILNLGIRQLNVCSGGAGAQVYAQISDTF